MIKKQVKDIKEFLNNIRKFQSTITNCPYFWSSEIRSEEGVCRSCCTPPELKEKCINHYLANIINKNNFDDLDRLMDYKTIMKESLEKGGE